MKLISVTMKLFFWEKFHCDLKGWKTCRFKSLRFDFCVINFDTMKFILIAKVLKILVQSHFWQKKKRNASIISILEFQYGGGEGSRTPVRKCVDKTFSGCSRLLNFPVVKHQLANAVQRYLFIFMTSPKEKGKCTFITKLTPRSALWYTRKEWAAYIAASSR